VVSLRSLRKYYRIKITLPAVLTAVLILFPTFLVFNPIQHTDAQQVEGVWTEVFPSPYPGQKRSSAWAYDSINNVIVLFGGFPGTSETWIYDLATETWEQKFPVVSPPSRVVHAMTFDSENDVVVLFGGFRFGHGSHLNDTWTYDLETNTWTQLNPIVSPSPRHWPALAFDKINGVAVLFGGHSPDVGSQEIYNDTWILDVATETWTQVSPSQSPSPRQTFLIYNESDGLLYLFGGFDHVYLLPNKSSIFYNDMWSYDVLTNTWTQLSQPEEAPEVRRTKLAYDRIHNLMILYGGDGPFNPPIGRFTVRDDTWVYDFDTNTWTEIITTPSPDDRYMNLIMYDSTNHKTLLYGGTDELPYAFDDFWELELDLYTDNQQPVADAGSDETVIESSLVTLDGTGSSDPDDDTLTYLWTQTLGPNVTLSDATIANPTFVAPPAAQEIILGFLLVVNDGLIDSIPDSVLITVSIPTSGVSCLQVAVTIVGSAGDDLILGTEGNDVIHGLGGNDVIRGLGGNDLICGGDGEDELLG